MGGVPPLAKNLLIPSPLHLEKFSQVDTSPHQILPKASSSDCIPVVVLKNCEPELSYILTELFNKCHKKYCFPDCWKVSSVFPVFKNTGERSTAKNYCPISLLLVVSKVFEKLDFQYGFRSSQSTADLLTIVSARIARVFNKYGATRAGGT